MLAILTVGVSVLLKRKDVGTEKPTGVSDLVIRVEQAAAPQEDERCSHQASAPDVTSKDQLWLICFLHVERWRVFCWTKTKTKNKLLNRIYNNNPLHGATRLATGLVRGDQTTR